MVGIVLDLHPGYLVERSDKYSGDSKVLGTGLSTGSVFKVGCPSIDPSPFSISVNRVHHYLGPFKIGFFSSIFYSACTSLTTGNCSFLPVLVDV